MSCGIGHRHGSDLVLLWLWLSPAATVPIRPLAWEPPYAADVALKGQRDKKKCIRYKCTKYKKYIKKKKKTWSSLVTQQVKDLALSLLWLGSLLWHGFIPWPRNFHMPQLWPKTNKQKRIKNYL